MKNFKAVAFDIDGTLYPNHRMYMASFGFALRNLPLLRKFNNVRRKLRKMRPIDDFYALQAKLLAEEIGVGEDQARDLIHREFYTNWESTLRHVHLFPGVVRTFSALKSENLSLAVLSDFPVVSKLKVLNIENYFDLELSSEEVGYLKPNPEPFMALLKGLGVRADELLYVGNSYKYDIKGAAALGIRTAFIRPYLAVGLGSRSPGKNANYPLADFCFTRYGQLLDWIRSR